MPLDVFAALVCCGFINALWNCLLKAKADPTLAASLLAMGGGLAGLVMLGATSLPGSACLPFLLASVVVHMFYWTLLGRTYSLGDMGLVYPLMRGLSPLATTGLGLVLLDEVPSVTAWLGILAIVAGLVVIALLGRGTRPAADKRALLLAALTACCITGYSIIDGSGARLATSGFAYTALLYVCNGVAMLGYGMVMQRAALREVLPHGWLTGLFSGSLSLGTYSVGVWAMTKAPIGVVAAVRETSILFAVALSILMLRERPRPARICGAVIVCGGAAILRAS